MIFYDVVIVGAGPAGLSCARELAKSGRKILIIEKNNEFEKKVCAGGIISDDFNELNLPSYLIENEFEEIIINVPCAKGKASYDKPLIYTINRKLLADWQIKKIEERAVDIRFNSELTSLEGDRIEVNNSEKIRFGYLVGADGSLSKVRSYLGLRTEKVCFSMQYIIDTVKIYDKLEIFFSSKFFNSWYAWIFPHKDYISIGCGCDLKKISPNNLKKNFYKWADISNIDISKSELEAFVINSDFRGYKFNNIFLAGDAAGFASYLTGEGICEAIVSGEEIAKMIISENYNSNKINRIIERSHKHNKVASLLTKSGIFRNVELYLGVKFLKYKKFNDYLIKRLLK